jgi:predicted dinucleotide-binding enzyme
MRIAIIGAGQVGTALGTGWAKAGHDVTYGVRDPARAPSGGRTASVREAVAAAEVVVLATPWRAVGDALRAAGDFAGRVLIDVTNPVGAGFELVVGHTTSGAEQVASLATGARVVKAFNTTGHENLSEPRYGERRLVMPVAGDDADAVEIAARLATDLGFEAVRLQGLARARELEPLAMLWIKLALAWGHGRQLGFAIARRAARAPTPPAAAAVPRSIAIVGTGHIGAALARAWLAAGHRVALAVRDAHRPEVEALVALGARAVPVAGAAAGADLVVLAVPADAVPAIAPTLGDLSGKILVDCTNAIAKGFALQYGHTTSSAEEVARSVPAARVVRAFHQQGAETLQDPRFDGLRAVSFVAGDDPEARAIVSALARDVGLDAIEAGPLASARYLEPITLLWVAMARVLGTREFALALLRRPGAST